MARSVTDGGRLQLSNYRGELVVVGAGAVLVVVVGVRLLQPWTPLGDHALMRLWVESVGGSHTPLIGPDSHYGWNHLGPWLFYVLALPYRIIGGSAGLLLGAALVNLGAAAVAVMAARAAGGPWAGLAAVLAISLYVALSGTTRLLDPWNPTVVLVVLIAAVMACWAAVLGRTSWVPVVVALGSLCVQAHIAFAPPALLLIAFSLVVLTRSVRRGERDGIRALARTVLIAGLAWLPLVLDMGPWGTGDLSRVVRFMRGGGGRRTGVLAGLQVTLHETGLQARWLGGREPVSAVTHGFAGMTGVLPGAGLVVLIAAAVLARRRHDEPVWRLSILLLALVGLAPVAVGALVGPLYPYLFEWVAVVGMLCCFAAAVLVARLWAPSGFRPRARRLIFAGGCLIVAIATLAGPLPRTPREAAGDDQRVLKLVEQATMHLSRVRAYRTLVGPDRYNSVFEHGVVSELARRGIRLRVTPDLRFLYGTALTSPRAVADPVVMVVVPYRGPHPGDDVIAFDDPLSPPDRQRERELTTRVSGAYRASGHDYAAAVVAVGDDALLLRSRSLAPGVVSASDLRTLLELRRAGPPIAIVLRPPILVARSDAAFGTWLNTTPAGAAAPPA
jgi:hypothetical protein